MSRQSEFKTPKGTILPLLDMRGKPYLQVAHRLVWFREEKPEWRIETHFVQLFDAYAIACAKIMNEQGQVMATGHKREDQKHFPDHMEKAETGAIGRALAMIGYGTQFAPELDEGDRLADAPTARATRQADNLAEEMIRDGSHNGASGYRIPFGKYKARSLEEVGPHDLASYVDYLEKMAAKENKPISGQVAEFIRNAEAYIAAFENGGGA